MIGECACGMQPRTLNVNCERCGAEDWGCTSIPAAGAPGGEWSHLCRECFLEESSLAYERGRPA